MHITAIETRYAGCHFRSRLEARWAVFFDELGIEWHYEPQGFEIYGGSYYLPDFHLPKLGAWVEVKGELTGEDLATIINAVDYGGSLPGLGGSGETGIDTRGLLLLGPIPLVTDRLPLHSIFQHHEGVIRNHAVFIGGAYLVGPSHDYTQWTASGLSYEQSNDYDDLLVPALIENYSSGATFPRVVDAYHAARSARFEHGQSGRT